MTPFSNDNNCQEWENILDRKIFDNKYKVPIAEKEEESKGPVRLENEISMFLTKKQLPEWMTRSHEILKFIKDKYLESQKIKVITLYYNLNPYKISAT